MCPGRSRTAWPTLARGWFRAPCVFFLCVEDAVDRGGPQPLGAIEVEGGVVPGLDHEIAGVGFAGAGLDYVLTVRGAVGHIAGSL